MPVSVARRGCTNRADGTESSCGKGRCTRWCVPLRSWPQLDRLAAVTGLDTLELGIVPFTASLKIHPGNGFWIYDERRVVVEDWHAEMWLDDAHSMALYLRTWKTLQESAVYGSDAQSVINDARRSLNPR